MPVRRLFACLLILAALVLIGLEAIGWWYQGTWEMIPLSALWAAIDRGSLIGLQATIESTLWPGLWPPVRWALNLQLWGWAGVLGLVLLAGGGGQGDTERRRRFSRRR